MPKPPNSAADSAEKRRRAEARLGDKQTRRGSRLEPQKSEADVQRLLHELEVHQIELEMQNEELSEARDKMEALLEKYTDLYDFAPVGYLTIDQAGNIREANLAASNLLEVPRSELVNRPFGKFLSATDLPVVEGFLQKSFATKRRQSCEVALQVPGSPPLMVKLEGIVFEAGQACRVILTDITDMKRAEADRLILNKLESTGILAGGIAHDFNNLLTAILLNIELAQMQDTPSGDLARYLEEAKKSCSLARNLTAQLVTFAKGDTLTRLPAALPELIKESAGPALSGSNARCEFFLAGDLWPAEVDAAQFAQVIRNLILNAREAMPKGGMVTVRAKNVELGAQEKPALPAGKYVRVSIADQGTGMHKDVLPKIFDPYFSTKERGAQKGMGLGLTICHSIIQKHQGAISVESAVGVGTTVHVYLPAKGGLRGADKPVKPARGPQPARILVMEDDEAVKQLVGRTLTGMGHAVELAPDGQTAVELYQKAKHSDRPFDVVILDLLVHEGMGGRETLQALVKLDPGVQAIAMSGNVLDPVLLEPERHGFQRALTKPFEARELRVILTQVTGRAPGKKIVHE